MSPDTLLPRFNSNFTVDFCITKISNKIEKQATERKTFSCAHQSATKQKERNEKNACA